jgi:hypothetical protein
MIKTGRKISHDAVPLKGESPCKCFRDYWQLVGRFVKGCQRILATLRQICCMEPEDSGNLLTNSCEYW